MKVKKLIKLLKDLPPDYDVHILSLIKDCENVQWHPVDVIGTDPIVKTVLFPVEIKPAEYYSNVYRLKGKKL
jgi:hypothetical protein